MAKVGINRKKLGLEMAQLREIKKVSLEELSAETGMSVEYLRNLEAGEVQKVRRKEMKRLGKAFAMPAPCIQMLGMAPEEIPDRLMGQLAENMQSVIRAAHKCHAEQGKPKKKKKEK